MVLRSRPGVFAGLFFVAVSPVAAPRLCAQMHHVDKPEKVTRAVGVYEWTGDLHKPDAARFVPVSVFIDGHFEDAGVYLPRPVPFALQTGDLYTVQHAGEPEGELALENAARVVTGNALADDDPAGSWYGYGKFTAEAPPRPVAALRKSAHLSTMTVTAPSGKTESVPAEPAPEDGKPQLSRRKTASPAADDPSPESKSPSSERTSDDTDRPTLARRDPAKDAERRKAAGNGRNSASVVAAGPAPGEDPDRPTLSRTPAGAKETEPLTGMPAGLHQAVAVSDPVMRDPHPFTRAWETPGEQPATMTAMAALARPRVEAYLAENRLLPSAGTLPAAAQNSASRADEEGRAAATEGSSGAPPKLQRGRPQEYTGPGAPPAGSAPAAHAAAPAARRKPQLPSRTAATPTLHLQAESLAGYTLSYGGLPTFVYTAAAPVHGTADAAAAESVAFVTVIAQRLPSGELQPALISVTDSRHLDRGPRLRLVDVVDPDASHRASLLFELQSGRSRQFALYRLISAHAENTFTTAAIE